jgi:glycerate kinase
MGKLPSVVLNRTQQFGIPVVLLAGRISDRDKLIAAGFRDVVSINPDGIDKAVAMMKTVAMKNLRETARKVI